jgi:hypothetical protein
MKLSSRSRNERLVFPRLAGARRASRRARVTTGRPTARAVRAANEAAGASGRPVHAASCYGRNQGTRRSRTRCARSPAALVIDHGADLGACRLPGAPLRVLGRPTWSTGATLGGPRSPVWHLRRIQRPARACYSPRTVPDFVRRAARWSSRASGSPSVGSDPVHGAAERALKATLRCRSTAQADAPEALAAAGHSLRKVQPLPATHGAPERRGHGALRSGG